MLSGYVGGHNQDSKMKEEIREISVEVEAETVRRELKPVSYTHLDVYKRQDLYQFNPSFLIVKGYTITIYKFNWVTHSSREICNTSIL